jgi:hypothetical protein
METNNPEKLFPPLVPGELFASAGLVRPLKVLQADKHYYHFYGW